MYKKQIKLPYIFSLAIVIIFSLISSLKVFSQATITHEGIVYPVPPNVPGRMFYLQRTPNTNTISCDLNMVNGKINLDNPLTTYWLRYGDSPKGEKKELNFIQRKFAYGLNIHRTKNNDYDFYFVSYKKYHMYLVQTKNGEWKTCGEINNALAYISSIFIYIKGGSFWNPHVVYVELRGRNIKTGQEEIERLTDVKKEEES